MGDWLDTPADVLVMITIVSAIFGGLVWLIKAVAALQRQTKPNGGSSLRDAFDRLEKNLDAVHSDVREIRSNQQEHMTWHLNRGDD